MLGVLLVAALLLESRLLSQQIQPSGPDGLRKSPGFWENQGWLGTDLGFNFTLGVNRACRAGQAPPWSVPWDGRRAKRIFWLCRELSRARTRWYVHGCVHMCARVHACVRARAGKKARTRSTNRLQHSPVALSVSRSHRLAPRGPLHGTGASRPPAERAPQRAREVGLGGGREGGRRAGGRAGGGSGKFWSYLTGAREAAKDAEDRRVLRGQLVESGRPERWGKDLERPSAGHPAALPARRARPLLRPSAARALRGREPRRPLAVPAPVSMLLPQLCWLLAALLPPAPAQKFSALTVSPGPRGPGGGAAPPLARVRPGPRDPLRPQRPGAGSR